MDILRGFLTCCFGMGLGAAAVMALAHQLPHMEAKAAWILLGAAFVIFIIGWNDVYDSLKRGSHGRH